MYVPDVERDLEFVHDFVLLVAPEAEELLFFKCWMNEDNNICMLSVWNALSLIFLR